MHGFPCTFSVSILLGFLFHIFLPKVTVTYDELGIIQGKYPKILIFEVVATYFYPKPYNSYGEFGRIRMKYPKILIFEVVAT